MEIVVQDASRSDKLTIRNLMQMYKHDMSVYNGDEPDEHGVFEYNYLDHYWTGDGQEREGRRAFLVRVDGRLAGFVLVNNQS